jgi:hypothetical protein
VVTSETYRMRLGPAMSARIHRFVIASEAKQSRLGAPTLDCFGAPLGAPRNDEGESA